MSYLRSLSRTPGFSSLVVLTMSLVIGTTTALFSVVDAVLLEPLPYRDSGRVVAIHTMWLAKDRVTPRVTGGDFLDLRSGLHSFSAMASYYGGEVGVQLGDHARFARTFWADPNFFRVLDITPTWGRLPQLRDADQTAVLNTSFARANWGDPARAIGQIVRVDNRPLEIIGLVDSKFAFPERADLWVTAPANPENRNHSAFNYYAVGRLRPRVKLTQAQAELSSLAAVLSNADPDSYRGKMFRILSLQEDLTGPARTTILFLFGAAGLLLFISCANAANLMLARAIGRTRDIAVRVSLGSGTAGVVRLLLAEGALLGCFAAIAGVLLAYIFVHAIAPFIPATVPRAAGMLQMHGSVLIFAIAVSVFTVMACSLAPALRLRGVDVSDVLKQSPGRGFIGGEARLRNIILVTQIALCCVLCVGAALLSRSLVALLHAPLGYDPEGVLVMYADAPAFTQQEYMQSIRTFESALDQIRAIPGVRFDAAVMGLPTGKYGSNGSYLIEGVHIQAGQDPFKMNWPVNLPEANFALASPQYFKTLRIPLFAGRDFTLRDQYDAPFTAVISQSLARQSFGSSNPIGKRIYCGLDSPQPMTIVGVVGDVRQNSPASRLEPEIYMPFQQHPAYANKMQVVMRSDRNPRTLIPEVRKRIHRLAPLMATNFTTLSEMVQESIAAPRFRAALAMAFALLAITLAVTGVYGVMAYYVSERRAELGLRMALGADRSSIVVFVFRRALSLGVAGLAIGLACAVVMSRTVGNLLYGIRPLNLPMYCMGAAVVLMVTILATCLPTWSATRIDPAEALRRE